MNQTEFESQYKAKYLNLLPEDDANKFIDENREDEGYTDDHLNVCWRDYVKQCAIDDLCEHYQMQLSWATATAFEKWINDTPPIKALFDLRSKGD